jgi:hypothetical protein
MAAQPTSEVIEHGARPSRNQRAHPMENNRPCGAEARSSDPEPSAARAADVSTRTTRRTRRGGLPEDRARSHLPGWSAEHSLTG